MLVGALGLYRMPDLFTRIHAAGIVDTMGATFLLVGMGIQACLSYSGIPLLVLLAKLFALFLLFFYTSPVATHALAQAALADGLKPIGEDKTEDTSKAKDNTSTKDTAQIDKG